MLKTRVVTAVVLLIAFLGAFFLLPAVGWIVVAALIASVAAWEWGGLMRLSPNARIVLGVGFAMICGVIAVLCPGAVGVGGASPVESFSPGYWLYGTAALFWFFCVPLWLVRRWPMGRPAFGLAIGLVALLPTWLALIQLRLAGDYVLLGIMAIVWLADIGAYFVGRALGRHKLAPSISPGKTWEGAIGGCCAVIVYGFLCRSWLPLQLKESPWLLLVILVGFAATSIVGDLFESLLKRQAGIKDSSQILPGHGGVLDRIDSLTSTLPIAALLWQVFLR